MRGGSHPMLVKDLAARATTGVVEAGRSRPGPGRASPQDLGKDPLFRLDFRALWRWMLRQPASFWLISLYLFLEYVRPQQIYAPIAGWPIPFWTIVLSGVVFVLEGARLRRLHLGDWLMIGAAAAVVLSTAGAYDVSVALGDYSTFFGWFIVYFLITNIVRTRHRIYVLLLLYLLFCIKMTQHGVRSWASGNWGFDRFGVVCAPGWFQNSGECGAQMAALFPVSLFLFLALRTYWASWKRWLYLLLLPLGSLLTIIATSSRGAVVALGAAALWFVAKSRHRLKVLIPSVVVAVLSWYIVPTGFQARFKTMGDDPTSLRRLTYWHDGFHIMNQFPIAGVGYNNWLTYYRRFFDATGQVPHNIFIEAGAQTGYFGLLVFVACILGTFVINSWTRRMAKELPDSGAFYRNAAHGFDAAMIAFLVAGSFVTILYYPIFWINLAMVVSLNLAAMGDTELMRRGRSRAERTPFRWDVSASTDRAPTREA